MITDAACMRCRVYVTVGCPSVGLSVQSMDICRLLAADIGRQLSAPRTGYRSLAACSGGSVAEWLGCWTQAQKGLDSNRSSDAVG